MFKFSSLVVVTLVISFAIPFKAIAKITELESNHSDSYYYVENFEVTIDKSAEKVWPYILEMGEWMPWMASVSSEGDSISQGDRVNLYGDFFIEVTKIIPNKLILLTNLPSIDKGEKSQGIVMISVTEIKGKTLVSIFMSRIYHWLNTSENTPRETRETSEFVDNRKALFRDKVLLKLKQLAESN